MKRLRDVLKDRKKELGLTNFEIARRAGLTDVYISLILRGKRLPSDEALIGIGRALEMDLAGIIYLAHWEKAPEETKGYFVKSLDKKHLPPPDLPDIYDRLSPYPLGHAQTIPVLSRVPAGGFEPATDGDYPPGAADDYIYSDIRGRNLFALRVENDSMEPLFHEGDILIVNPNIKPKTGDYVIAKLPESGEATFKKLVEKDGITILRPLNPDYDDIVLTPKDTFEIIGRVVERKTIF